MSEDTAIETAPDELQEDEGGETTRLYELGYLLVPHLDEDALAKEVETLKNAVGAVVLEGKPRKIDLAYMMHKVIKNTRESYEDAFFGWIKFNAELGALAEIKKVLEGDETVIRFLITHSQMPPEPPKKIFRARPVKKDEPTEAAGPVDEAALEKEIEEMLVE